MADTPVPGSPDENADLLNSITYLELGGRTWALVLSMATMARFEKATGVNMLINSAVLFPRNLSMTACQALLWAAMSQQDPDLKTPEEVGRMILPRDLDRIGDAIHDMLHKGLPEPDPEAPSTNGVGEKKTGDPTANR